MYHKTLLLIILASLAGCATTPSDMYSQANQSCQTQVVDAKTYSVTIENMPGFIEPVFVYSSHQSLQKLDLLPAENPDLHVKLVYEHRLESPAEVQRDTFDGHLVNELTQRFDALVNVTVTNKTGQKIWSGSLNRYHSINGTETFHSDRAAVSLVWAFDRVFENMLKPCTQD